MQNATVFSRANYGLDAPLVTIEVHLSNKLPNIKIVGMPERSVKESKERVYSAIINSGFEFPRKCIIINMAPAHIIKTGSQFDLPIAIGILAASSQIDFNNFQSIELIGELSLDGSIRNIPNVIPAAIQSQKNNNIIVIPYANLQEAQLSKHPQIYAPKKLDEVAKFIHEKQKLPHYPKKTTPKPTSKRPLSINDIVGHANSKRALIICATGGHHMLMYGPPGTGKSMLAKRLNTLLPPITEEEAVEIQAIHSLNNNGSSTSALLSIERPFREPHHTSTSTALAGGGSPINPGEISYAHKGILFLDELPEFKRNALEILREPLESRKIMICRANQRLTLPADFQLIAAMNPCPRGIDCSQSNVSCECTEHQVRQYHQKLSSPLLDRIDICIQVSSINIASLQKRKQQHEIDVPAIKARINSARDKQIKRCGKLNSHLSSHEIQKNCALDRKSQDLIQLACKKFNISMRGYHRLLKVARTIADFEDANTITETHVCEAIAYRNQHNLHQR